MSECMIVGDWRFREVGAVGAAPGIAVFVAEHVDYSETLTVDVDALASRSDAVSGLAILGEWMDAVREGYERGRTGDEVGGSERGPTERRPGHGGLAGATHEPG